jgi:lipoyl-dependent peroxiredoxin
VAGKAKVTIPAESSVTGQVGIGNRDDGEGFGLDVTLTIKVPGADRTVIEDLVQKAHIMCPYSNAIRGNVGVRLVVA